MPCKGFKDFTGCETCIVALCDKRRIKRLTPGSMSEIIEYIMSITKQDAIIIEKSTVSCTGVIYLEYNTNDSKEGCRRQAIRKIIKPWYVRHRYKVLDAIYLMYLSKVLEILSMRSPEKELHNEAEKLTNAMSLFVDTFHDE